MRRVPAMTILLTGALLLTGCGSDGSDTSSVSSSSPAPEDVTTSPQAVKAGLTSIVAIAADVKAQVADKAKATELVESIEPAWEPIEGTVKKNDADTYIALEDAFAVLGNAAESGDAAKAASGSDSVSQAVSAYLARFPG